MFMKERVKREALYSHRISVSKIYFGTYGSEEQQRLGRHLSFCCSNKKIGTTTHHIRAQEQSGQSSYVFPPNEKHVLWK